MEKVLEENKNQKSVSKQQLLSELFGKNNLSNPEQKQPQNMSGLLNLNKQQQKMLTDSKFKTNVTPQSIQPVQNQSPQPSVKGNFNNKLDFPNLQKLKCVDKMEIARKEYEAAMFALQQKQSQDSRHFQGEIYYYFFFLLNKLKVNLLIE